MEEILIDTVADDSVQENRRTGKTTRLLDKTIQDLFSNKKLYIVFINGITGDDFLRHLHSRLVQEHNADMTILNTGVTRVSGHTTPFPNTSGSYRLVIDYLNVKEDNVFDGNSALIDLYNKYIDTPKARDTDKLISVYLQYKK